jgi:hypothetical protein
MSLAYSTKVPWIHNASVASSPTKYSDLSNSINDVVSFLDPYRLEIIALSLEIFSGRANATVPLELTNTESGKPSNLVTPQTSESSSPYSYLKTCLWISSVDRRDLNHTKRGSLIHDNIAPGPLTSRRDPTVRAAYLSIPNWMVLIWSEMFGAIPCSECWVTLSTTLRA